MTRHIRLDPTTAPLDCDAFARLLADWLEDDLRPTLRASMDAHRAGCGECAALVASLDDLRTEAAALPPLEPPADLWAGIERRIGTRVVALPVRGPATDGVGRRGTPSWLRSGWAAAAAALLVAGIGGAGYLAARSGDAAVPALAAAPIAIPGVTVPTPDARPSADVAPAARLVASATIGAPTRQPSAARPAAAPASPLDVEIARLRRTLEAQRTALDTATARALEANLAILDGAIRESRAALVEEPTSQLLHEQLNHALDAKLELMRTAVILSGDD